MKYLWISLQFILKLMLLVFWITEKGNIFRFNSLITQLYSSADTDYNRFTINKPVFFITNTESWWVGTDFEPYDYVSRKQ